LGTLASALTGHRLVALDTSVWIYHFEGSAGLGQAADRVLEAIAQGRIEAVASELVLLELLVAPLKKDAQDVADEIELTLRHGADIEVFRKADGAKRPWAYRPGLAG